MEKAYILFMLILLVGCKKFKSDPVYPDLPKYSERGANIGGAFIDTAVWRCESKFSFPNPTLHGLTIRGSSLTADSTRFDFYGNIIKPASSTGLLESMRLLIVLKGVRITRLNDLLQFNAKKVILDGRQSYVRMDYYGFGSYKAYKNLKGTGELIFDKVFENTKSTISTQGTTYHPIVTAGRFNFEIGGLKITEGRFDFTNSESNFKLY